MDQAALTVDTLRKLEGTQHRVGAWALSFERSPNNKPAARGGGEGYVAPVRVIPPGLREFGPLHILKFFFAPTVERKQRFAFLRALGLSQLPLRCGVFSAVPVDWISGPVNIAGMGVLPIDGYIAPLAPGQTLEELICGGWNPPLEVRVHVARQLCAAIEVLEGGSLTHADLAPRNLLVSDHKSATPTLRLVDYDGFYHPRVPQIPIGRGGRTWGTPGYRARIFHEGEGKADSVVNSDRVALAALVMEIVTRMPEDDDALDETFVRQEAIQAGDPSLPREIAARWPEGAEMLARAVKEANPQSAISPKEWRAALSRLLTSGAVTSSSTSGPSSGHARFPIRVCRYAREDVHVPLRMPKGSFAQAAPELSWLSYERNDDQFILSGEVPPKGQFHYRPGSPDAELVPKRGVLREIVPMGTVLAWADITVYLG